MPGGAKVFDDEFNVAGIGQQGGRPDVDASFPLPANEKESTKENNVAKIKVVVGCSICLFVWDSGACTMY